MHNLRKRLVVVPMLLVCFAVSIVIIQQTMSFGGMGHADAAVFIFAAILLFHFLAFCIGLAVDFAWPTALLTVSEPPPVSQAAVWGSLPASLHSKCARSELPLQSCDNLTGLICSPLPGNDCIRFNAKRNQA